MAQLFSRRDLIKAGAYGALGSIVSPLKDSVAGPFDLQDYEGLVPLDKKLSPAWIEGLRRRGTKPWISGEDLKFIGMPVGGFFAGTVYLGGDGQLWNWDIFNEHHEGGVARPGGVAYGENFDLRQNGRLMERDGANYVDPPLQQSPFEFSVELVAEKPRKLCNSDWASVRFLGQYPIGTVEYTDPDSPVSVRLMAFSPFVPHEVEASSYPATVLQYTIQNDTNEAMFVTLRATSDHPSLIHSQSFDESRLRFREAETEHGTRLDFEVAQPEPAEASRPDVVFEDFESGTYDRWTTSGTAFGERPRKVSEIADYQGDVLAKGEWTVNSHNTRQGEDVAGGDAHTGTLLSEEFTLQRNYVNLLIGGGNHPRKTCVNLVINGQVAASLTGHNSNAMRPASFDVRSLQGKRARIQIIDDVSGPWGNIGVDEIVQSDKQAESESVERRGDYGTFSIAVDSTEGVLTRPVRSDSSRPRASIETNVEVPGGGSRTVTIVVAWHYPNLKIPGMAGKRRWYSSHWADAASVANEVLEKLGELTKKTVSWRDTWYDSTLPYWLLDRTFANTSTLATNTAHRFEDGRFWFWEGIGCCAGTCTHVWSYAQAAARLFPEIERDLRERIDFGEYINPSTGAIDYRAEFGRSVAVDGQCGCVLRAYREHTMQLDDAFLKRIWPNVKKATQYLIGLDPDRNGMLEGAQYNTLDTAWYGPMSWISSMYLGALRASEAMATEVGDSAFARECRTLVETGSKNIIDELFDGEYFIHAPDTTRPDANATGKGCHIDQLYGESWCHWNGLERVLPQAECRSALACLYKYNFTPDVGPYRKGMKTIKGGRWYAVPGEGGLIMTTFPKGGADRATGKGRDEWAAMYFNECMSGFEYQAAAHMVAEGLVTEGLAVTRMIHDRYAPSRRNPYNEIECSDHYGRAMASFGVFWNLCGYRVHGPKGEFSASPKLPGEFRAAFIDAEGWGTYDHTTKLRSYKYRKELTAARNP